MLKVFAYEAAPASDDAPAGILRLALKEAAAIVRLWLLRSESRRTLAELTDYQLRDIGLFRSQALAESEKPFWKP